jgi:hypothetical protein
MGEGGGGIHFSDGRAISIHLDDGQEMWEVIVRYLFYEWSKVIHSSYKWSIS